MWPWKREKPTIVRAKEGNIANPPGERIREIFKHRNIGFAEADIKEAKLHIHRKIHEYYYVVEGEGRIMLDADTFHIKKGDFVHIPPGIKHKAFSDKGFRVLVVSSPKWNAKEHKVLE
ncbi:MAG: cupin domain-containing protein [Candidatus Diapherotrites archaeon]|nr:cupin domain-containing protein [Candidatus Diapherotrites archaeon]